MIHSTCVTGVSALPCPPGRAFNRSPLAPAPLAKAPLGSVRPAGWLAAQLDLMVGGMAGRLAELSHFLAPGNGWLGGPEEGWEEQPYWFRGFHDLAILTRDPGLLAQAQCWIESVVSSQDASGYFGPQSLKQVKGSNGQLMADLWPHMVMLDPLIHHTEYAGDERIPILVERFLAFCRDLPEEQFMPPDRGGFGNWKPFVQHARAGDMLPHIYWLYNQTGETWLLDLALRFYRRLSPPQDEWLDRHIVNFTQRFAYPGLYAALSGDPRHLTLTEYWYNQHLGTWGQQPRGIFGADEQIRPGKVDPRQGFETCGMVEFAKSFYLLGRLTGNPAWADRCEDVILNHFTAAQTPDLTGLHYLTAANMPQLDAGDGHDFYNEAGRGAGPMLPYSPGERFRCCQHNHAMGWPWYAQNLWQLTADGGAVAWLYAPCALDMGPGRPAFREVTSYPFRSTVALEVTRGEDRPMPLYLRVPGWCSGFSVRLNGQSLDVAAPPRSFVRIERAWDAGDTVEIDMPMVVTVTEWPRTGSLTADRGPLSYSVHIAEEWRRFGGSDKWPEWEVFPASPWGYGLPADRDLDGRLVLRGPNGAPPEVIERPLAAQPWNAEEAPLELRVMARRIPGWRLDDTGTVQPLRQSPIRSDCPEEAISMIPLGCARLRMACLPRVALHDGLEARTWEEAGAAFGAYLE